MTLTEWVLEHGRAAARRRLADALGVTEGAVRHWCNGQRRVPPAQCQYLEIETEGMVTCEELRPDVFKPQHSASSPLTPASHGATTPPN